MKFIQMGRETLPPLSDFPREVRASKPVQTPVHT
jgi:hypothetical protein